MGGWAIRTGWRRCTARCIPACGARCCRTRVTPSWRATPRPRRSPRSCGGATPSTMSRRGCGAVRSASPRACWRRGRAPTSSRPVEGSTTPTGSVAEFLAPVGRPVPATAGLRCAALCRQVHVTRDRRAARDQCGHRAGAAAPGPRRAAPHDHGGRACVTTSTPWWRTDSRFSTRCPSRTHGHVSSAPVSGAGPTTEEVLTMIDLETPVPTEPRPKRPMRVVVAGILARPPPWSRSPSW